MVQQFKGNVIYVSDMKQGKNGWFTGFKIDTIPKDFLNDFKDDKRLLIKTKVGDKVAGTFEKEGKYNVIKTFERVGFSKPEEKTYNSKIADFKQADDISSLDLVVESNQRLMDAVSEVFVNSNTFTLFKDDKESQQKLITTLFITGKQDLSR